MRCGQLCWCWAGLMMTLQCGLCLAPAWPPRCSQYAVTCPASSGAARRVRHHRRAPPRARSSCRDSPTQKRWRAGPRPPLPAGRPQLRGRSADTARRGECRPGTVVMVMFQSCPTNVNTSCCDNWDLCFHVQPQ